MTTNEIFKYSILAAAHLISCLSEKEVRKLRTVILFGSVAQGNANLNSDVDIFFNVSLPKTSQRNLRIKLNKEAGKFYLTNAAFQFKLKGIDNQISLIVGNINEWPDLKRSMASGGIVLYGKYSEEITEKSKILFSIDKVGRLESALLNKLYGYKAKKKRYLGLIQKLSGKRLGRAFIIPSEQKQEIIETFKKYQVEYSMQDIWV